ncbi:hypothetical protein HW450_10325 [Corynebacterium hindlerae]|uniref:Uncharacterized protein n=1 Tax=Corynebacterium hindlerae TaxID=699041 RepID=A0A7G5FDN8_9CORY|nr:hypothetical protein [Corynebacterium hindlerae]QMV84729.1 hypothetical protein HW450_10325 [Corynebacterium hindlerae]
MQVKVNFVNGRSEIASVIMSDMVAYERTARIRDWGGIDSETSRLTAVAFLAWHSLNRNGVFAGQFDEFLNDAELVEAVDETSALDPTTAPGV